MKTLQFRLAGAMTALALGLTFLLSGSQAQAAADPSVASTGATITKLSGRATVFLPDGSKVRATKGMSVSQGSTISTGFGSVTLDLGAHGVAVVGSRSSLVIDELSRVKDQEVTKFNLKKGELIGDVKKVAANSKYEVQTAKGVAGIRGTAYHILAIGVFKCLNGNFTVTLFTVDAQGNPKVFVVNTKSQLDAVGVLESVTTLSESEINAELSKMDGGDSVKSTRNTGTFTPSADPITVTGTLGTSDNGRTIQVINRDR